LRDAGGKLFTMLYTLYEMNHAAVAPWRMAAHYGHAYWTWKANPLASTELGRSMAASLEMFERLTRRYGKPEFGITSVPVDGIDTAVEQKVVWEKPFCKLLHFSKQLNGKKAPKRKILIVAPMSGHYATLLRGTVEAMLPHGEVYITDWTDARDVPLHEGEFSLDDFIDYLRDFISAIGPRTHVIAVCQPSVPALATTALMAADDDPHVPASLTLMGGPIDTRINPTAVNRLAEQRSLDWFEANIIARVPFPNPGFMRKVYPGFLQLTGFMSMNLERHTSAHVDLFHHLIQGDDDSVRYHNAFYEEYLAVMDLPATFYLETVDRVFMRHALPERTFRHRGRLVDCSAIRKTGLFTIEGERDDICGVGQTAAAHPLCPNIPDALRKAHVQPGVGHYGVFNGSRFRREIRPRITDWVRKI